MQSNIIPRIPAYTNEMMLQKCLLLESIINMGKEVKVGRGKNVEVRKVLKYDTDQETIQSIKDSIEYYKTAKEEPFTMFKFRDYQTDIINQGCSILKQHRFLYLAMQVRTGKTLTSLGICKYLFAENVLFITKKKVISTIQKDYETLSPAYNLQVINYESLHTVCYEHKWDVIICDEAHSMGAFPKPSNRAEDVGALIDMYKPFVILLSGTPTPESYSQMYHQLYKIPGNPFAAYKNFYRFADDYVKVGKKKAGGGMFVNDYSDGLDSILEAVKPYTISYTQAQAGFVSTIEEQVLEVHLKPSTIALIERLKKDLVIEGKEEVILADTAVKLMSKVHQLSSGTIKFESGNSMIVDKSKAEFIKEHFAGCKIGIFYCFKEELVAIKEVFGDDITTDIGVFDDTDKSIALQIVSGREGISLKLAEYLVYYNIDFSATSYWQSRDRMTTMDRPVNKVYWVFSYQGIEWKIFKAVTKKLDYTVNHFKKDLSL
jgi:hypothetical protein